MLAISMAFDKMQKSNKKYQLNHIMSKILECNYFFNCEWENFWNNLNLSLLCVFKVCTIMFFR